MQAIFVEASGPNLIDAPEVPEEAVAGRSFSSLASLRKLQRDLDPGIAGTARGPASGGSFRWGTRERASDWSTPDS